MVIQCGHADTGHQVAAQVGGVVLKPFHARKGTEHWFNGYRLEGGDLKCGAEVFPVSEVGIRGGDRGGRECDTQHPFAAHGPCTEYRGKAESTPPPLMPTTNPLAPPEDQRVWRIICSMRSHSHPISHVCFISVISW